MKNPTGCSLLLPSLLLLCRCGSERTLLLAQALTPQNNSTTCRIVTFIPFTDKRERPEEDTVADANIQYYGYGSWPDQATLAKASFSLLAAAELARVHFNERNPILVPELESDVMKNCSITISPPSNDAEDADKKGSWYLDSAFDRRVAVYQLLELLERQVLDGDDKDETFCAIVGPRDSFVSQGVSVITEAMRVPQIAYSTIGYRLSNRDEYPSFFRVIPEAYDYGAAVAKFFQRDIFQRETAGIIYADTDYGEQFESPIEEYEDELDYATITESFKEGDDGSIEDAMQEAKDNGFFTIVVITDRTAMLDNVANIADELGMLGGPYFYILSGRALPPAILETLRYEVDSPVDRMLRGAALYTNYDPFVYLGETDPFLQMWRNVEGKIVESLKNMQPDLDFTAAPYDPDRLESHPEKPHLYEPGETYFQTETPSEYASFMYDAVITAGLSACSAPPDSKSTPLSHVTQVPKTQFQGASGRVKFKVEEEDGQEEYANSRDPEDVIFGIYNIQPGIVDENDLQSYTSVLTHLYSNENDFVNEDGEIEQGAWKAVEGTDFLFFDGTPNEPLPRRKTFNPNFLSRGVQISGLTLCGLAVFLAFLSGVWVFACRREKVVKASQPEFLYLLCFGAALVGITSVFSSFDEDKGLSEEQLTKMCQISPFIFVIGYLAMYCALFSKLWRLSRLLQLRRQAVQIKQVLWPLICIGMSAILVLVVLQIHDPLIWEREAISEGEALYETYGNCRTGNEHGIIPYLVPLAFLIFLTVAITAYFAWKMKDVQAELSESRWIFAGIAVHIQTWLVGVPLIYITDGVSRDASYLMKVILGFTFSTSLVGFIIWPKIYACACERFGLKPEKNTPRINVAGSSSVRVSGIAGSSSRQYMSNLSQASTTEAPTNPSANNRDVQELQKQNSKLELRVAELEGLLAENSNSSLQHMAAERVEQAKPQQADPSIQLGIRYEL